MSIQYTLSWHYIGQYDIGGWRIYARVAPYEVLEDTDCGDVIDTSSVISSGRCEVRRTQPAL